MIIKDMILYVEIYIYNVRLTIMFYLAKFTISFCNSIINNRVTKSVYKQVLGYYSIQQRDTSCHSQTSTVPTCTLVNVFIYINKQDQSETMKSELDSLISNVSDFFAKLNDSF